MPKQRPADGPDAAGPDPELEEFASAEPAVAIDPRFRESLREELWALLLDVIARRRERSR
jgi:hypothetical protein